MIITVTKVNSNHAKNNMTVTEELLPVVLVIAVLLVVHSHAYLPILTMHGIDGSHHDFDDFGLILAKHHPGTPFFALRTKNISQYSHNQLLLKVMQASLLL
jgi:hypothetical protein